VEEDKKETNFVNTDNAYSITWLTQIYQVVLENDIDGTWKLT
jgi:hypothetical protein